MVECDENERTGCSGDGEAEVAVRNQAVGLEDESDRPPRRKRCDHVVADVEALAVPGRPVLEPGRDVLDDGDHDHELRREEENRRDQEDVRRVVGLVARRLHEGDLRDCGADREEDERQPDRDAVLLGLQPRRERQSREERDDRDCGEVGSRRDGEATAGRAWIRPLAELGEVTAHGRLTMGRLCPCPVSPGRRSRRGKMAPGLNVGAVRRLGIPRASEARAGWFVTRPLPRLGHGSERRVTGRGPTADPRAPPLPLPASSSAEFLPGEPPRNRQRPPR